MAARRLFVFLAKCASWLDDRLRYLNHDSNRTAGGLLVGSDGVCRHSYHFLLFPALLAGISVMGIPEAGTRLVLSAAVAVGTLLLIFILGRLSMQRGWPLVADLVLQAVVVIAVAGGVWLAGTDKYEKGCLVYRQVFVLSVPIVGAAILFAGLASNCLWKGLRPMSRYRRALRKTELFRSHGPVPPMDWGVLGAAMISPVIWAPFQLLIFPAIAALFAPPDLLGTLLIAVLLSSYAILLLGGVDPRLEKIWRTLQYSFFRGGTRLVSLAVIALAVARWCRVDYVTTVFDTTEGGVLALVLLSAYVLFWWYDYWVNRVIAQELLRLLRPKADRSAHIPYPIKPGFARTSVPPDKRVLQIHGSTQFIVIREDGLKHYFETYAMEELFETLAVSGAPGGKAVPTPAQVAKRIFTHKLLAAVALALLAWLVVVGINRGIQQAQLTVDGSNRAGRTPAELLFDANRPTIPRPLLLIAASGGGTRAALYTAAVLEAMARQGMLPNAVMGSGVSGGGAAMSYFAGSRPGLMAPADGAWESFFAAMKQPFITDVLNGSLEWRIVFGHRLGLLLSESFKRRWNLPDDRNEMGEIDDFGLILNTAIAGRFRCSSGSEACRELPLYEAERRFRKQMTSSEFAGGRLILTNLALRPDFAPSVAEAGGPSGLPVVVNDRSVRLEDAAALSANFPTVFSNAAIDVAGETRYWVTDGGAADNRGVEMLLYALLDALQGGAGTGLPAVTVAALDASAFSATYVQDRGVGSLTGAGAQFASLLVAEQLRAIRALYARNNCPERFRFVYLPMPLCLRESGSFGTHWMLQPRVEIRSTSNGSRTLTGEEMITLLRVLHGAGMHDRLSPDARDVLEWARRDEYWRRGARELGLAP
jgi:hypothetical protein